MKFTLRDKEDGETVRSTAQRLRRGTWRSVWFVAVILAVSFMVWMCSGCAAPEAPDVIDQAIAARIYNKQ